MGSSPLGCEKPNLFRRGLAEQLLERVPDLHLNVLPIIQARPAHLFIVQRKSKWLDQVESGSSSEAEPARRSGIVRDLGCDKDEIKHFGGNWRIVSPSG